MLKNILSNIGYQLPYLITLIVALVLLIKRRQRLGFAFRPAITGFAIQLIWSLISFLWRCRPYVADQSYQDAMAVNMIVVMIGNLCAVISTSLMLLAILRR